VQKADKIKGKAQAALKNLDAVIANNRADALQQDTEYWKKIHAKLEEKKTEGIAYDTEGNLINPLLVAKAHAAELDDTRPPEFSQKDRNERHKLLEMNQLLREPKNTPTADQKSTGSQVATSSSDNKSDGNKTPGSGNNLNTNDTPDPVSNSASTLGNITATASDDDAKSNHVSNTASTLGNNTATASDDDAKSNAPDSARSKINNNPASSPNDNAEEEEEEDEDEEEEEEDPDFAKSKINTKPASSPKDDPTTNSDDDVKTDASDDPPESTVNNNPAKEKPGIQSTTTDSNSLKRSQRKKNPPRQFADEQAAELKSSAEKAAESSKGKRKRNGRAKATAKKLTVQDYTALDGHDSPCNPSDFDESEDDND
jgi:hypothetical protein